MHNLFAIAYFKICFLRSCTLCLSVRLDVPVSVFFLEHWSYFSEMLLLTTSTACRDVSMVESPLCYLLSYGWCCFSDWDRYLYSHLVISLTVVGIVHYDGNNGILLFCSWWHSCVWQVCTIDTYRCTLVCIMHNVSVCEGGTDRCVRLIHTGVPWCV